LIPVSGQVPALSVTDVNNLALHSKSGDNDSAFFRVFRVFRVFRAFRAFRGQRFSNLYVPLYQMF